MSKLSSRKRMMAVLGGGFSTLLLCCPATPVAAQPAEGFLAGLRFGEQYVSNTSYPIDGSEAKMEFSIGPVLSAFVGYRLIDLRFEGEVSRRGHDIDSITGGVLGGGSFTASGDMQATTYMLNMYMDMMDFETFVVYVGAGIGSSSVELDGVRVARDDGAGRQLIEGSDNVVTFQVMIGTEFRLGEQFGIDLMYSFLSADDPTIGGINIDFDCHALQLGGRYYF